MLRVVALPNPSVAGVTAVTVALYKFLFARMLDEVGAISLEYLKSTTSGVHKTGSTSQIWLMKENLISSRFIGSTTLGKLTASFAKYMSRWRTSGSATGTSGDIGDIGDCSRDAAVGVLGGGSISPESYRPVIVPSIGGLTRAARGSMTRIT